MVVASLNNLLQMEQVILAAITSLLSLTIWIDITNLPQLGLFDLDDEDVGDLFKDRNQVILVDRA